MGLLKSVVFAPHVAFDSVRVFTSSMHHVRAVLGDHVSGWIAEHPHDRVTEIAVMQSSDSAYHCYSIIVFYRANDRTSH